MTAIRISKSAALLILTIGLGTAGAASASMELARSKNCIACHSVDKPVLGPAYKEVAAKYAGDKEAVAKLAKKVREGGVGVWGQVPMPANPQVTEAEAQTLAKWVLGLK
ncbi:MAG: cytochrome C' [Betaproteobacteria bacterium]|nr:cytochrome C' [Betaproteobacteria bacterium]